MTEVLNHCNKTIYPYNESINNLRELGSSDFQSYLICINFKILHPSHPRGSLVLKYN